VHAIAADWAEARYRRGSDHGTRLPRVPPEYRIPAVVRTGTVTLVEGLGDAINTRTSDEPGFLVDRYSARFGDTGRVAATEMRHS
jgi:hypothetical protein